MAFKGVIILMIVVGALGVSGCQTPPTRTLLPAPAGTALTAARHNDEGMQAYQQQQWAVAKEHFEAANSVAPDLAEAHYNLGMTFYRLGNLREGDTHFIMAANLAPGNKVIWSSPPLGSVSVPEKVVPKPGHGGDGHSH